MNGKLRDICIGHRTTCNTHVPQSTMLASGIKFRLSANAFIHQFISPLNCLFNHTNIHTDQICVVAAIFSSGISYLCVQVKAKTTAWALFIPFTWYLPLNEKDQMTHQTDSFVHSDGKGGRGEKNTNMSKMCG